MCMCTCGGVVDMYSMIWVRERECVCVLAVRAAVTTCNVYTYMGMCCFGFEV